MFLIYVAPKHYLSPQRIKLLYAFFEIVPENSIIGNEERKKAVSSDGQGHFF